MNEAYENLMRTRIQAAQSEAYLALALFAGFILFFMYWGMRIPFLFIPAVIFIVIGYFIYKKFPGDYKGPDFWIDLIKNKPENIVWIKPITTKHTVGLIVTLYKEQKFQILTADGLAVTLKCDKPNEAQVFLNCVRDHMPLAHLGYTDHIKRLYKEDSNTFIEALKEDKLYTPITMFNN